MCVIEDVIANKDSTVFLYDNNIVTVCTLWNVWEIIMEENPMSIMSAFYKYEIKK